MKINVWNKYFLQRAVQTVYQQLTVYCSDVHFSVVFYEVLCSIMKSMNKQICSFSRNDGKTLPYLELILNEDFYRIERKL